MTCGGGCASSSTSVAHGKRPAAAHSASTCSGSKDSRAKAPGSSRRCCPRPTTTRCESSRCTARRGSSSPWPSCPDSPRRRVRSHAGCEVRFPPSRRLGHPAVETDVDHRLRGDPGARGAQGWTPSETGSCTSPPPEPVITWWCRFTARRPGNRASRTAAEELYVHGWDPVRVELLDVSEEPALAAGPPPAPALGDLPTLAEWQSAHDAAWRRHPDPWQPRRPDWPRKQPRPGKQTTIFDTP